MAKRKDGKITTTVRFDDPEVFDMLNEMCEHYDRSQNKMINICIKEQYKVFKAKKG